MGEVLDLDILLRAREEGMGAFGEAENSLLGMAKAAAAVAVVLAGGLAVSLGESIKLASDFQTAQVGLNTALKNAGESLTPQLAGQLETLDAKMRTFGRTDTETTEMVTALTQAGLSWSQVMLASGPIADLAAAKHLDLATATKDVILGMQGSGKALKDLNITLPPTIASATALANAQNAVAKAQENLIGKTGKAYETALQSLHDKQAKLAEITQEQANRTDGLGAVLDALSGKLGGSASAQAETFAGHVAALRAELDHAGTVIGLALIPYVDNLEKKLAPLIRRFSDWAAVVLSQLTPQMGPLLDRITSLITRFSEWAGVFVSKLVPAVQALAGALAAGDWAGGLAVFVETMVGGDKGNKLAQIIWAIVPPVQQLWQWIQRIIPPIQQWAAQMWQQVSPALQDLTKRSGDWKPILEALGILALILAGALGALIIVLANVLVWIIQLADWMAVLYDDRLKPMRDAFVDFSDHVLVGVASQIAIVVGWFQTLVTWAGNAAKEISGFGGGIIGKAILHAIGGDSESHAVGGIVGGALNQPQLALLHGGEEIIPVNRGSGGSGGGSIVIDVRGAIIASDAALDQFVNVISRKLASQSMRSVAYNH